MDKKPRLIEVKPIQEIAIIVGIELKSGTPLLSIRDSLDELKLLAKTADVEVVYEVTQRLDSPNPKTYIGAGKIEELSVLLETYDANMIIFDDELSPRHQRELEEIFGISVKIIDRTALILDIFSQHAHTREGILQVELAQYQYRLPRLTKAWTHLARQTGGGGGRSGSVGGVGLRGPGEQQLEVDRREIRERISKLKEDLEKVREHRARHRIHRKKSQIPVVALVGYTNAGKSTLMNQLTGAEVFIANQLFATLDPTTRKLELSNGQDVLLTDTVGFIQKLPTQLIAAFRATLEEISEADLLLHVIDITHKNAKSQAKSVLSTLEEIGAGDLQVLTVLNKVDKINESGEINILNREFDNPYLISALKGTGIEELKDAIASELFELFERIKVHLPFSEGQLVSLFYQFGHDIHSEHDSEGVMIEGGLPKRLVTQFRPFKIK